MQLPTSHDATVKTTSSKFQLEPKQIQDFEKHLTSYHEIYSPRFYRKEQREWSLKYLQGRFLNLHRKTTEPVALNLKGGNVRQMQHFVGAGKWADEPMLARHQLVVAEELGCTEGVIIGDGSDFPKSGTQSVAVARQHCGSLGKIANCQAGVFLAYRSDKGHTLLDRRLYVPAKWFSSEFKTKREKCAIPSDLTFKEKTKLLWEMLEPIIDNQTLPFRWILFDDDYGKAPWLLDNIAAKKKCYLADVPKSTRVFIRRGLLRREGRKRAANHEFETEARTLEEIVGLLGRKHWFVETVKEGSKGPIVAAFACFRACATREKSPGPDVWVIIRRRLDETAECKFFLSNAPITTSSQTFVRLSGMRWPIETIFEEEKDELGMDHYEMRSWAGWHHHMTLAIRAHYFLVRLKNHLKAKAPALTLPQTRLLLSTVLPQRKLDILTALEMVQYDQTRNAAAHASHRKATLRRNRMRLRRKYNSS